MRHDVRALAREVPGLRRVRNARRGASRLGAESAPPRREARSTRRRRAPTRPSASRRASPSSTGCSEAGSFRPRSSSSAVSPALGSRRCSSRHSVRSHATDVERCSSRARSRPRRSRCAQLDSEARTRWRSWPRPSWTPSARRSRSERPDVCVIDSVQTLHASALGSAPGSVAQVREAAGRLLRVAKEAGVATVLVGHVTKDGAVAGPRVLEHLVDCVLQFEGDRYQEHRVLRATKNRFGSTNELGVFEMTAAGLVGVPDPSRALRHDASGRDRRGSRLCPGRDPADLARDPGARRPDRSRDAAAGRNGRRSEAPRDDRRRPRPSRRRRAGERRRLRQRRRRGAIEEPGADLAVALAIASAARGVPVREGSLHSARSVSRVVSGQASQAERRLEECAKLGIATVVAPGGHEPARSSVDGSSRGRDAPRRRSTAGLEADAFGRRRPRSVLTPLRFR